MKYQARNSNGMKERNNINGKARIEETHQLGIEKRNV
jgi:hypothetical protein